MKNIIILFSILTGLASSFTVNAQNSKTTDQFEVQVDGLGCPFCAYGLEKKFKELKGIKKIEIDIETGDFSFTYPSEKNLTLEKVVTQVEKAGYTPKVAKIIRSDGSVETTESKKTFENSDNLVTDRFKVFGKCSMCKARIEKAAVNTEGVQSATWNQDQQELELSFSPGTSVNKVKQAVAAVGHDTEGIKAKDSVYNALPACCFYKRDL